MIRQRLLVLILLALVPCIGLVADEKPRVSTAAAAAAMGWKTIDQKIANLEKKKEFNQQKADVYLEQHRKLVDRSFGYAQTRKHRARYFQEVVSETQKEIERLEKLRDRQRVQSEEKVEEDVAL